MSNTTGNVILAGGEDLVSSGIEIAPGRAQLLYNYTCSQNGGYAKVPGYIAYDGQSIVITFTTGDGTEPVDGERIILGAITAEITDVTTSSGTWAGGDAAGTITVTSVIGGAPAPSAGAATFSSSASTCTATAVAAPAAVPGSGDIKGVWVWNDHVYAVRSDGGAPTPKDVLYVSSAAGWVAAPLGLKISFTGGGGGSPAPLPVRGDVLTQGAVTGIISGVAVTSGNFESAGTAAGYLYIHTVAGGSFSAAAATYGPTTSAITLSSTASANALTSGVRYEFRNENFSANANAYLMYFVNAVDPAYEYDGNALVAIRSGVTSDKPNHIEAHGQRLFLSFPGGNIMFSSPGSPTTGFTQDYTAGSVSVGDECTGMKSMVGGALAIFGKRNTKLLNGNISGADGDMQLTDHSRSIGAREWSIQDALDVYFLSDIGATSLYQTDKFGNFAGSGISQAIDPLVKTYLPFLVASVFVQESGFWRIFFNDGTSGETGFITANFSAGRMIGWSRGAYSFELTSVCRGRIGTSEVVFAGASDGKVYKLETGRSHDGSHYKSGVILAYNQLNSPMVDKQWRKTIFQLDGQEPFDFNYAVEFNYSQTGWPSGAESTDQTKGGGAFWGVGVWNTFTWTGSVTYGTTELDTFGVGYNMAIVITTDSDNIPNHTLRAYSSIYEPRRLVR